MSLCTRFLAISCVICYNVAMKILIEVIGGVVKDGVVEHNKIDLHDLDLSVKVFERLVERVYLRAKREVPEDLRKHLLFDGGIKLVPFNK